MDERRIEPLTDAALDREIEAALAVDPSPDFVTRVRLHATRPRALFTSGVPGWSWVSDPRLRWASLAGACALVALFLLMPGPGPQTTEQQGGTGATGAGDDLEPGAAVVNRFDVPTGEILTSVASAGVPRPAFVRPARPDLEAPRLQLDAPPLPEVLFSETERRALGMLLTGVQQGELPPMAASTVERAEAPTVDPSSIEIDPLVITPLQIARLEGERP